MDDGDGRFSIHFGGTVSVSRFTITGLGVK